MQPVSWLISHVLLRSCHPSSSSLSSYHSASVSSRQLENLTTTFETIADLDSYRRRGNQTGRYLSMLHTYLYSNPKTICIGHWSTLHMEKKKLPFSPAPFPPLINHFCWPTMKDLEFFSLGDSWLIEMVTVLLLVKAKYRYDNRQIHQIGLYIYMSPIPLTPYFHPSSVLINSPPT